MNNINIHKKIRNVKTKQERMGGTKPEKDLKSYYKPVRKKYCQNEECLNFFVDSAQFLDVLQGYV